MFHVTKHRKHQDVLTTNDKPLATIGIARADDKLTSLSSLITYFCYPLTLYYPVFLIAILYIARW